ncbi:ROK family transcriptional regulator [Deinococcus petrolearius]|uniref:ROK family protein n=1 Tax=Deinococcus petrolearius TaxID=1751295 RepID=A0ABW1DJ76_9DEIO
MTPTAPQAARRRVYGALRAGGPATRPELARRLGLSLPTVIGAVDELLRQELACLEDAPPGGRGRPAARVRLTPERLVVTALDLGSPGVTGGRYDLHGTRLSHRTYGPPTSHLGSDPADTFDLLLKRLREQGTAALSVVSILGAVHPHERTLDSYALGLRGRRLEAELGAALGWPVRVENDANLCAWHAWHVLGLRREDPLVFLNYSHGIGLGLMLGGEVYHGATGAAGEVSFAADPAKRGRHELLARRLLRHLEAASPERSIADVAARASAGDRPAGRALRAYLADLTKHLTAVAAVLDPALMVLQDIPHAAEPLRAEVQRALGELGLHPGVMVSPLGPLGGLDSAGRYGGAQLEEVCLAASAGVGTP